MYTFGFLLIYLPILVQCPPLLNGVLSCPIGATGLYGDTCTFYCNPGYELQGAQTGTCLDDQTWSGGLRSCVMLNCPNRILTLNASLVPLQNPPCTRTYLSQCRFSCSDGFIGNFATYLCNVTSDSVVLKWTLIGGVHSVCERGLSFRYNFIHVAHDNNMPLLKYITKPKAQQQKSLHKFRCMV